MSSTVHTETKEDSTQQNQNNIPPKKTKKKKKKKAVLYQETAVKYYDGFMKNKRYKKGVNLSTGCAILKIAWELPENNGLILPSRVMRHFKQILPKKPKQNKKKKAKKDANPETKTDELEPTEKDLIRSRTMMEITGINTLNLNPPKTNPNNLVPTQPLRRTMIVTTQKNKSLIPIKESTFDDKIEDAIDNNLLNENSPITPQKHVHVLSKSVDNLSYNLNTPTLATSDTPVTPHLCDIIAADGYSDHADIRMEDMKPDVEETPMMAIRAETDIKHMHDDVVSFKIELMDEKKEEKAARKKKKKKAPILYAEAATKLFKKINDGKRLKNGITLKKACNIFAVAWELPEENGRILPSKVARHFKQVLPSKKNKKNMKKSKSVNIRPSMAKSNNFLVKPQTMRGHAKPNWSGSHMHGHHVIRSVYEIPLSANGAAEEGIGGGFVADLETLLAADPLRSNSNDHEKHTGFKRKKAGSLTDLDLDIEKINDFNDKDGMDHMEEDEIVENEIEQLIREKKKLKEKELGVINAIDASLRF